MWIYCAFANSVGPDQLASEKAKGSDFVCVEVLGPSQPNRVMSSTVSLPNHTWMWMFRLLAIFWLPFKIILFTDKCVKYYVGLHFHKFVLLTVYLILVMLNKLRCYAHFLFPANQITWSRFLIEIHIFNDKQCISRSAGFFRSQLIWIYTVC